MQAHDGAKWAALTSWGWLLRGGLAPGQLPALDAAQARQLLSRGQGGGGRHELRSGAHQAAQLQACRKGGQHLVQHAPEAQETPRCDVIINTLMTHVASVL